MPTRASLHHRLFLLLLLAAVLPSCDSKHADASSGDVVGVVLPFSGEMAVGAQQIRRSLELGAEQGKAPVRFSFHDDGGQPRRTAELVTELAMDPSVVAIVGGMTSPCALAAAERVGSLKIPFITPTASSEGVAQNREWVFRMCFSDPEQGDRMARFAWTKLGHERVAILRDVTNDYSLGLADAFTGTFLDLGGQVVAERAFRRGYDGAGDVLSWLRQTEAQALYLPLYSNDIIDIIEYTRPYWSQRRLVFLGGDGWHSTAVTERLAGMKEPPAEIYVTAGFAADRSAPAVETFLSRLGELGDAAAPTSSSALAYDLGSLLSSVLASEPLDRTDLRNKLRDALADFHGATGRASLDAAGEQVKDVLILRWSSERWRLAP